MNKNKVVVGRNPNVIRANTIARRHGFGRATEVIIGKEDRLVRAEHPHRTNGGVYHPARVVVIVRDNL